MIHETNKDWQAQDDVRTLAEASMVKKNPARMKAATSQAKIMVADEKKRLAGLLKVAKTKPHTKAPRKTSRTNKRK